MSQGLTALLLGASLLGSGALSASCAKSEGQATDSTLVPDGNKVRTPRTTSDGTPIHGFEVVKEYPHDTGAYTQGLLIKDGILYESTGRFGESGVRIVNLDTGKPEKTKAISPRFFGEGLAAVDDVLYQVTWTERTAFVFDRETLQPLDYTYSYEDEGWGLTTSPEGLVMSNGTNVIQFVNPKGFKTIRSIEVTDAGRPVDELNELEWINGEIWANVWKSDRIARIDPQSGKVLAWIDFRDLVRGVRVGSRQEDVLNGIAFDADTGNIYVTGKRWPKLFHVRIIE